MRASPSDFEQFQQVKAALDGLASGAATAEARAHYGSLSRFIYRQAEDFVARERAAVVFRPAGRGEWEVGTEGDTRVLKATTVGVQLAHQALRGERPPASNAAPRAVRVTAANWARAAGCPRLAMLMLRLHENGGRLEYRPGPCPPVLVLA